MNIILSVVTALLLSFVYTASYSFSETSLYSAGVIGWLHWFIGFLKNRGESSSR